GGAFPRLPRARLIRVLRWAAQDLTRAVLRGASLPVVRLNALLLSLRLGHVSALLGLAVPSGAGAVIHLATGIDPNLAGACGSRSGALAPCWRWLRGRLGRRANRAGCCRGRAPRLHAAMTPTGAGTLRTGEGGTVLAGGGDGVRVLRADSANWQEKP